MFQLSTTALRWVLAISMACFLFAWPLHEAEHAGEPVSQATHSANSLALVQLDHLADASSDREGKTEVCLWCLFHAGHFPLVATHIEFSTHAEACPPPEHLSPGLPLRHCPLAAKPRGPPLA